MRLINYRDVFIAKCMLLASPFHIVQSIAMDMQFFRFCSFDVDDHVNGYALVVKFIIHSLYALVRR
jgi:hypothetical protein